MFTNKGVKKFNQCSHRSVDLEIAGNEDTVKGQVVGAKLTCPYVKDKAMEISVSSRTAKGKDTSFIAQSMTATELRQHEEGSPRVGWDVYKDSSTAHRHLARVAGEIACTGCRYADASIVEVAKLRAGLAEERREAAGYEEQRLAAEVELKEIEARNAGLAGQLEQPLPESGDAPD